MNIRWYINITDVFLDPKYLDEEEILQWEPQYYKVPEVLTATIYKVIILSLILK